MSGKHTKGPWRLEHHSGTVALIVNDEEYIIANLQTRLPGKEEEMLANANLLVASLSLFKALEPFAAWLEHPTVPIMAAIRPEEWEAVTNAFNQAKGVTPGTEA